VKENKDSYELQGELPGIEQSNLEVAFVDQNTLQIKGRTERHREEGTRPGAQQQQQVASQPEQAPAVEAAPAEDATAKAAESDTSSFHKATVEDDFETVNASDATSDEATMSGGNPEATPAETPKQEVAAPAPAQQEVAPAKSEQPRSHYWVSERSVGQFARTFRFPSRVDQENVKASLKDGILSIVVPKAAAPENRRIEIQ
jgi:HSP20 family molecular chaperone IbpA